MQPNQFSKQVTQVVSCYLFNKRIVFGLEISNRLIPRHDTTHCHSYMKSTFYPLKKEKKIATQLPITSQTQPVLPSPP